MNAINNNNFKSGSYISKYSVKQTTSQVEVIEAKQIPSDDDMSLGEKILMNVLVWGGFAVMVWTFVTGNW